jgi:hypothetical protein
MKTRVARFWICLTVAISVVVRMATQLGAGRSHRVSRLSGGIADAVVIGSKRADQLGSAICTGEAEAARGR